MDRGGNSPAAFEAAGLEPPTSPTLEASLAKGLDALAVSYQTRLPAHGVA